MGRAPDCRAYRASTVPTARTEGAHQPGQADATTDDGSTLRVADQWEQKLAERLEEARSKQQQQQAQGATDAGAAAGVVEDIEEEDMGSLSGHESYASGGDEDAWA